MVDTILYAYIAIILFLMVKRAVLNKSPDFVRTFSENVVTAVN